jgi:hypothetical protein
VTAPVVRDLADRWDAFERAARQNIELFGGPEFAAKGRLRVRRVLSPEFLADILRRRQEYEARGIAPTQALAREERVSPSAVQNWLAKARAGVAAGEIDVGLASAAKETD